MNEKIETYPFKSKPIYKHKIWGGKRIKEIYSKQNINDDKIGESWETADLKEGASLIGNGKLEGKTLTEAVKLWGENLIGTKWKNADRFPLLVKIIDAQDDLSIQVHPDSESCKKFFPQHFSKDESWYILDAEEGNAIIRGFKKGITLKDYLKAIEEKKVTKIVKKVEVRKGDCLRIPPCTVHALLKGIMILEIQEPSDSTFRIYDYNRPGDDGKPRPIHLEEAKKVMNFEYDDNPLATPSYIKHNWGNQFILIDCPAYKIEKWELNKMIKLSGLKETVRVLFNLEGILTIESKDILFKLKAGETAIIPAESDIINLIPEKTGYLIVAGASGISLI